MPLLLSLRLLLSLLTAAYTQVAVLSKAKIPITKLTINPEKMRAAGYVHTRYNHMTVMSTLYICSAPTPGLFVLSHVLFISCAQLAQCTINTQRCLLVHASTVQHYALAGTAWSILVSLSVLSMRSVLCVFCACVCIPPAAYRSVTNRAASVVAADAEKRRLAEKVCSIYTLYNIYTTYAVYTVCSIS